MSRAGLGGRCGSYEIGAEIVKGRSDSVAKERVTRMYELHAPAVAAYVLRRSPAADAADAVAETFLVAWRRRNTVPEEPDTLPWLYGVARFVLANQRRGDRRRSHLAEKLAGQFVEHDISSGGIEGREELSRVAIAMKTLSADDVEVLRLASWEGLSPTEIAGVLGLAPGTARQRLRRARLRLRVELETGLCHQTTMVSQEARG